MSSSDEYHNKTSPAVDKQPELGGLENEMVAAVEGGVAVNAAGYKDQLKRQYGLLALSGLALCVDNAWAALGSSVYHWGTIAGGKKYGRIVGFFTGWINFYGWMFDLAALIQIAANIIVQMYATHHRDTYVSEAWHVYVTYIIVLWLCTFLVIFANKVVPYTQHAGMFFVLSGGIITIIVIAAMPKHHASNHFVWGSFNENNLTGWSGGVAFLLGVLNGAFTIGTPDAITHMAEELPHPKRDLPKAIGLQIGLGGLYAFIFAIAIGYAITDLDQLIGDGSSNNFPLAFIYEQATGSAGATFGLLFVIFLSTICCCVGTVLTNSRTYWALARDNAVPFSAVFGQVNEDLSCPVYATLFVSVVATGLGAIPLGSPTAFVNLTGSFIVLTTISYAIPMVANMATGRKYFPPGPFHLGKYGFVVNGLAVLFITVFDIFYCFPYVYPTSVESMNYNCVIIAGIIVLSTAWWLVHAKRNYSEPRLMHLYVHDDAVQASGTK